MKKCDNDPKPPKTRRVYDGGCLLPILFIILIAALLVSCGTAPSVRHRQENTEEINKLKDEISSLKLKIKKIKKKFKIEWTRDAIQFNELAFEYSQCDWQEGKYAYRNSELLLRCEQQLVSTRLYLEQYQDACGWAGPGECIQKDDYACKLVKKEK